MAVRVKIGEASTDSVVAENQVLVRFYDNIALNQTVVLRPKSAELAEKTALLCEQACENNNILYKLGGSASLYRAAKKSDFNFSKEAITTTCYADCSGFASIIAKAAGARININESNIPNCGNMRSYFKDSGDYEILTDSLYLNGCDYLRRGDIAVRERPNSSGYRHAAIILSNGEFAPAASIGTYIKSELTVKNITSDKASILCKLIKVENGEESLLTNNELKKIDLSKCLYVASTMNSIDMHVVTSWVKPEKASFSFDITDLKSGNIYNLELLINDDICKSKIFFSTPYEYPNPVSNLKVNFADNILKDSNFNITFNAPNNFEKLSKNCGYRLFLILNGDIIAYDDKIINSGDSSINTNISMDKLGKDLNITCCDIIQIGILPWVIDNQGKKVFCESSFVCSQPQYVKSYLKIIDKIHISIEKIFKRVLLHNRCREE